MLDGTTLRGEITGETDTSVSIRARRGVSITIPLERVRSITTSKGTRELNQTSRAADASSSKDASTRRGRGASGHRKTSPRRTDSKPGGEPSPDRAEWLKAPESPGYDAATAHDPRFGDKILWPGDVSATDYYKEKWPEAPLMVWARTDRGDARRADPRDPANWLIDGRPATRLPDESTDIVFPSGEYGVGSKRIKGVSLTPRHVTVGSGVGVGVCIKPVGNVWIKKGGSTQVLNYFLGGKHTFVRNDNLDFSDRRSRLANKIVFAKKKGTSVEVVGTIGSYDELSLFSGSLIVGPGAEVAPGNRSIQCIFPDARLVLMSGSNFHKRSNQNWATDMIVAGELLAGTPERPLTRDCTLGLCYKTKGNFPGAAKNRQGGPDDYGLLVHPDASMGVHSADPNRARLVITWCALGIGRDGPPDLTASPDGLRARPEKVDVVLQGDLHLDGVVFDWMRKGGIMMLDPSLRDRWTWAFGEHNAAEPDELFAKLDRPIEQRLFVGIGKNFREKLKTMME
jgi:hypothetical protein